MDARNLFDLTGRVAVVTGSSRGMGRAIAQALAAAGARVVISSRNLVACEEVVRAIMDDGGGALAIPCNISRLADVENLIHRTLEEWGRIDILVNNAAVNPHYGPLAEIDEETYDKSFDSNVKSSLWLARLAMPSMVEQGGGSVIIVSSVGGYQGSENLGVYDLTKAADFALARNLAVEWGGRNIRVNCIAPGLIKTDFSRVLWDNEDTHRRLLDYIPLGRMGAPGEVVGAVLLLASAAGSYITGQVLVIDGGALIKGPGY